MRVATSLGWLFLDLNSYFASVEQQLNPRLRGRPIVVSPVDSEATCAIAASYEAKAFGIKTGTKIYEARRKCPELIVVQARHDAYVEFHHRILVAIDRHLPITRICSIDEVACALLGDEQHPTQAVALARAIKAGIRQDVGDCLRSSVGIAPNAFLAKIASNMQKPDGLMVIEPTEIYERIKHLALMDLPGIAHNMNRRLQAAGVPDVATFWALPPKQARAIWGSIAGERFWMELHGYDLPIVPTNRSTVGHSHMLAPSLRGTAAARQVSRRLLSKAASRLRRLDLYAGALAFSVRSEQGERYRGEVRFPPTQDSFALLAAFTELWAQVVGPLSPGARFKKVSVTLHRLQADAAQPDLFDPPASIRQQGRRATLSGVLDQLNRRYGRDTITFGLWRSAAINRYTGTKIAFTRIPDQAEFHE